MLFKPYMEKKGFSLIEFLVSLAILILIGIALFNSIVFLLHRKLIDTLNAHVPDAAQNLIVYREKLEKCSGVDACQAFDSNCSSSIYCQKNCTSPNTCVVCYTNPDNGKKIFYSFNDSLLSNGTDAVLYKVNICWKYGGRENVHTMVISIPK